MPSRLARFACWLAAVAALPGLGGCVAGPPIRMMSPADICLFDPVGTYISNPGWCTDASGHALPSPLTKLNVNQRTSRYLCPLDWALLHRNLTLFKEVLAAGGDPHQCSDGSQNFYRTLAIDCKQTGHLDTSFISVLMQPEYLGRWRRQDLLNASVAMTCPSGVKFALDLGANVNFALRRPLPFGLYAADLSVMSVQEDSLSLLNLAISQVIYKTPWSALAVGEPEQRLRVVEALMAGGAQVDERTHRILVSGASRLDEKTLAALRRTLNE